MIVVVINIVFDWVGNLLCMCASAELAKRNVGTTKGKQQTVVTFCWQLIYNVTLIEMISYYIFLT